MTTVLLAAGALLVGLVLGLLLAQVRQGGRSRDLEIRAARAEEALSAVQESGRQQLESSRTTALHQLEDHRRQTAEQVAALQRQADERVAQADRGAKEQVALAERAAAQRVAAVEADQARLAEQFQEVANKVLSVNNEQFLALATEHLGKAQVAGKADLTARQEAVQALVGPLAESLQKIQQQVEESEKQRLTGTLDLKHQVVEMRTEAEKLRNETSQLKNALSKSQVRGAWGEMQLKRLVESAGMLDRVDFEEQVQAAGGSLRPDMVVRLSGGKSVVVDAKVSLAAFLEAQAAEDDATRAERLAAHARHMRTHVDDLHRKEYWEQFSPTPEFVAMFVPAESFLSAALEQDPALMQYALERNVILATPMTLLALLRTVAYSWRQDALAENAQQVLKLGREFHSRLVTMTGHVTRVGKSLTSATDSYNKFIGSLERNVLTSARRFAELDVIDRSQVIGELDGIDEAVRPITKAELLPAEAGDVVAIDDKPEPVDGTARAAG
ncbi:DNA recombination protein RmuC [Luteimicrobium subarcticum]|uniref:DNA recombination protein RmuC n=1 Tax=Luteimicrobium subarcticum TaxID=620910 RepID=A0A2M8WUS3_9MICO|nr:DNA recombination protein RmuC [Luteimicrobium subarcticum]PJI94664.1 DNA recombination protein RmuC [Luteimicrobium subarcticum]